MPKPVLEKVWKKEFELRSRRRTTIYFIYGLYIVAAVSSILLTLILGEEPVYLWQHLAIATLMTGCVIAANVRATLVLASHLIVATMFVLFCYASLATGYGVIAPFALLLPLIPTIAIILLGVTMGSVYTLTICFALIALLFLSPDFSVRGLETLDAMRGLMLVLSTLFITAVTAYIVSLNEQLVHALRSKGEYDQVTNLPNLYVVRDWLDKLFTLEGNTGKCVSVLSVGIDGFVEINEQRGSQVGDEVMSHVARALQRAFSAKNSMIARHRGNSFILVMPNATVADAISIAEEVQKTVDALKIPSVLTRFLSVSVGATSTKFKVEFRPARGLIQKAVSQLQYAQSQGLSQISVASDSLSEPLAQAIVRLSD